jgi:hypothetical protein
MYQTTKNAKVSLYYRLIEMGELQGRHICQDIKSTAWDESFLLQAVLSEEHQR